MNIAGKHIVITGGTSGIGLELVKKLRQANHITVIARPSARLEQLRSTFGDLAIVEADLADLSTVESAARQLAKSDSPIDILINNAAVQHTPWFTDESFQFETIKQEIDVNFTSICIHTYLLLPKLLEADEAMIVNMNSGLGLVPKTSSTVYCATKGALNIFSRSLANQLEGTGVGVKQVFLPLVDTAMTEGRGTGKMSAEKAAGEIIRGMSSSHQDINIGKVKILRLIQRLSPRLAGRIIKAG